MSRFRKKTNFMNNLFGRTDNDRSVLRSSSKLDEPIQHMSGNCEEGIQLDQKTNDSHDEFNSHGLDAAASANKRPMRSSGPTKVQSNDVDFGNRLDNRRPNLELFGRSFSSVAVQVDREDLVSPRRGKREKLRGSAPGSTMAATGESVVSPRRTFLKKGFSDRFLGKSPKGGNKANRSAEIKRDFSTLSDTKESLDQALEIKVKHQISPNSKTVPVNKSWKPKEDSQTDAVAVVRVNEKVEATIQKVQASDLQHSFHQLNLGEMVPKVFCEAVKSKELVNDLKRRNKHLLVVNDSSSEDESTEFSELLDTKVLQEEELDPEVFDIPRSKSAEGDNDDFLDCITTNNIEEDAQLTSQPPSGTPFHCSFDLSVLTPADNESKLQTILSDKDKKLSEEDTAKDGKQKVSEEVVDRKSRRNEKGHAEIEERTWVRSSPNDQQKQRTTIENSSRRVEPAFSPPFSPNAGTKMIPPDVERKSRREKENEKIKSRRSAESINKSPRQRIVSDDSAERNDDDEVHSISKLVDLNDSGKDAGLNEMKLVLDDYGPTDLSDILIYPDEYLNDDELAMKEVPFTSYFDHLKNRLGGPGHDLSDNTSMDVVMTESLGGGKGNEIIQSSGPDGISWRYQQLKDELEQSKSRLFLCSHDVSRLEREVEWLEHQLGEIKRS